MAVGILLALALFAQPALAVDSHVYDPVLSLTGGTGTSIVDPVPDPGTAHPLKPFDDPCGVATDAYGNVYVANGASASVGADGRIDVFDPDGEFITEVPNANGPCALAVDSTGRIYVRVESPGGLGTVVRYVPTVYEPAAGEIEYGSPPTVFLDGVPMSEFVHSPAVDPSNDHVFIARGRWIDEFEPDGTPVQTHGDESEFTTAGGVDVWGQNGDVLVSAAPGGGDEPLKGRAFVIDGTSDEVRLTLDGSNTPSGSFGFTFGRTGVAIDQSNGDLYVADLAANRAVKQFDSTGEFIGQITLGLSLINSEPFSDVAVDQGEFSPNRGYVYVTSGFQPTNSHLYAFAPLETKAPEVKGEEAEEVTETEALLTAELNPNGSPTTCRFEYGTADCATSPCQSTPVPDADGGSAGHFEPVTVPVEGLAPGTTYHFRLVARSHCNPVTPEEECVVEGADNTFETFPASPVQKCPNPSSRTGASARLPDCRAYELVTPPETNGRIPTATVFGEAPRGSTPVLLAAPDGESVLFGTEGGALPGIGGGGFHDAFVSTRTASGWRTSFAGLSGSQAQEPYAVGADTEHTHLLWSVGGRKGSLADQSPTPGQHVATYIRSIGGTIEPLGTGSLGVDKQAEGRRVSPGAEHVVIEILSLAALLGDNIF